MIKVCPSSNPCDESKLLEYAKSLMDLGVEYLHCDVMDGVFVENSCLSFDALKNVRDNCNILLDVHLMVSKVFKTAKKFAELKPNIITFHYEALKNTKEFSKTTKMLHKKEILVGLAIKPNTPIEIVSRLISYVDLVLIMSVEPGKSGQKFIESAINKIEVTKDLIKDKNIILEVDGGINEDNAKQIISAGADFLVMGKAFFTSKNKKELLSKIDKHYKD